MKEEKVNSNSNYTSYHDTVDDGPDPHELKCYDSSNHHDSKEL